MIEIDRDYYLNFKFLNGNHFLKDSTCFLIEIYVKPLTNIINFKVISLVIMSERAF